MPSIKLRSLTRKQALAIFANIKEKYPKPCKVEGFGICQYLRAEGLYASINPSGLEYQYVYNDVEISSMQLTKEELQEFTKGIVLQI